MRLSRPSVSFIFGICVLAVAAVASWSPAFAQGVPPCVGEGVSGTVVDVDAVSGTVTIKTGDGLFCTVTLVGEYEHPIVELLGTFFGDVSPERLAEALEITHACAVHDNASDTYVWAECKAGVTVPITVTGEEEDGWFTIIVVIDGEEVTSTVHVGDEGVAQRLGDALADLVVGWNLDEFGAVVQPGDEIAAYHDEGMGFGVILKLYAMAEEAQRACIDEGEWCDVTVVSLVSEFQSGVGMGELFKLYGKPALLGIGHVRHYERRHTERVHPSERVRASVQVVKAVKNGPKPKAAPDASTSDVAEPKPDKTGKPDNAGPKPKVEKTGKPDHAGPKPKTKDKEK